MELTVNQILDYLTSNYRMEDIESNPELSSIHKKLIEIKNKSLKGGIREIENSNDIITRISKCKITV